MKKKQVIDFFELFIKNYLVGDINVLDKIKKDEENACTIPQAMAVLSAIDLLGYLFGTDKDTNASEKHFFEFYRIVSNSFIRNQYNDDTITKLVLYRHGMMHHFFPNFRANDIGICKSESQDLFILEMFNNVKVESLNVSVLTRDFLLSVPVIENLINESSDDNFFDNILNAIPKVEISNNLVVTTTNITTACIIMQNKRKKK
jgi:hypothetical protein